jgi:hypothetical protein
MKMNLASLDAARLERRQHAPRAPWSGVAGLSEIAQWIFIGASLAMIACGIVAAALWFAWQLGEILP